LEKRIGSESLNVFQRLAANLDQPALRSCPERLRNTAFGMVTSGSFLKSMTLRRRSRLSKSAIEKRFIDGRGRAVRRGAQGRNLPANERNHLRPGYLTMKPEERVPKLVSNDSEDPSETALRQVILECGGLPPLLRQQLAAGGRSKLRR